MFHQIKRDSLISEHVQREVSHPAVSAVGVFPLLSPCLIQHIHSETQTHSVHFLALLS